MMIKQRFTVENHWEVVVYYDVDYHFFSDVEMELLGMGTSKKNLEALYREMRYGTAMAVTCSNSEKRKSVVILNRHQNKEDYINSIVHEAEHVKQAMLKAYRVNDEGEIPAYAVGYIVMKMWEVFKGIVMCA